jgi:hypothetical protein
MVEDSAYRKNESLPSWVPDPSAPLLPLPLDGGVLEDEVPVKWDATGRKGHSQVPAIQNKLLVVYGFRIDVVRMAAIQFNDLIDAEKWIELLREFLEPLKDGLISGVFFDEAFWKTLLTTTNGATIGREEFRDWIISIALTLGKGNDGFKDRGAASVLLSLSRIENGKLNVFALTKLVITNSKDVATHRRKQILDLQHQHQQLFRQNMNNIR